MARRRDRPLPRRAPPREPKLFCPRYSSSLPLPPLLSSPSPRLRPSQNPERSAGPARPRACAGRCRRGRRSEAPALSRGSGRRGCSAPPPARPLAPAPRPGRRLCKCEVGVPGRGSAGCGRAACVWRRARARVSLHLPGPRSTSHPPQPVSLSGALRTPVPGRARTRLSGAPALAPCGARRRPPPLFRLPRPGPRAVWGRETPGARLSPGRAARPARGYPLVSVLLAGLQVESA